MDSPCCRIRASPVRGVALTGRRDRSPPAARASVARPLQGLDRLLVCRLLWQAWVDLALQGQLGQVVAGLFSELEVAQYVVRRRDHCGPGGEVPPARGLGVAEAAEHQTEERAQHHTG